MSLCPKTKRKFNIFSSPKDMLVIDFREKKGARERNIDHLPPTCTASGHRTCNLGICALTVNQIHHLLVYRTMLHPTEPHQPALKETLKRCAGYGDLPGQTFVFNNLRKFYH